MPLKTPQTDRNGNPIPNQQGYLQIIGSDGALYRMRNLLWLSDDFTATDNDETGATELALANPPIDPVTEVILSEAYSASSISIPFTANEYKRIEVNFNWDGGGIANIALTGMSNATYNYAYGLFLSSGGNLNGGAQGANNWVPSITGSYGAAALVFSLPPAPATKSVNVSGQYQFNTTSVSNTGFGTSSDVTHDPTAIVITLDQTRAGYVYAVGYK